MADWKKLRRISAKIANALVLMIVGAWLLVQYLFYRDLGIRPFLHSIDDFLFGAYWVFLLAATCLSPPEGRSNPASWDISPRWSGTLVVLITGGAAAVFLGRGGAAGGGYWVPAIILVTTAILAAIVWRFATRHAEEIGEARFAE